MQQDSSALSLADRLRAEVSALRPGQRLPSSRALVQRYRVSPVTVTRALSVLTAEGLVVTRPGSGAYVAERPDAAPEPADYGWQAMALGDRSVDPSGVGRLLTPAPEGAVALSGGYLHPTLQPLRALSNAAARAARRPDAWEIPPLGGVPELRAWYARTIGGAVSPSDVLISSGGQQSLATVLRSMAPPGSPVLVESPTYLGVLAVARASGLHPVPVPADGLGLRPELLAEAFALTGARVLYFQPTYQNPTGATLAAGRRAGILAAAKAAGAFVVEDDYARHLGFGPPAPPPLVADDPDGRVVHIASLTKATAPSLRIAGIVARGPVAERIRATQMVAEFFPARPLRRRCWNWSPPPGGPGTCGPSTPPCARAGTRCAPRWPASCRASTTPARTAACTSGSASRTAPTTRPWPARRCARASWSTRAARSSRPRLPRRSCGSATPSPRPRPSWPWAPAGSPTSSSASDRPWPGGRNRLSSDAGVAAATLPDEGRRPPMTDPARDAAALLRDFVNTLDVETGADQVETPGRLAAWLDGYGLLLAAAPSASASEGDLELARDLREGLRTAMLAHHGPSEPAMPPALEAAFTALPLRVTLRDGHPRLVPVEEPATVTGALARIAAAVMEAVADGTWGRLKVCQESTCLWAFLDTSKNRSRAWCSMRVCGNRTKTRAYRARMRTTEGRSAEH